MRCVIDRGGSLLLYTGGRNDRREIKLRNAVLSGIFSPRKAPRPDGLAFRLQSPMSNNRNYQLKKTTRFR